MKIHQTYKISSTHYQTQVLQLENFKEKGQLTAMLKVPKNQTNQAINNKNVVRGIHLILRMQTRKTKSRH